MCAMRSLEKEHLKITIIIIIIIIIHQAEKHAHMPSVNLFSRGILRCIDCVFTLATETTGQIKMFRRIFII